MPPGMEQYANEGIVSERPTTVEPHMENTPSQIPLDSKPEPTASSDPMPSGMEEYGKEEKYGTLEQQLKGAAEGAAETLTFGTSTGAERALGIATPEDIRGRKEVGIGHTTGEIAGLLAGVGAVGAIGKLGRGAAALSGLGAEGASTASRIGAHAIDAATQMAALQTGSEVSKMLSDDPNQSVGTAAANVGLAGLMGGAGGAAMGAVSPLWKATVGNKVGQLAEDFKARMNYNIENPNLPEAMTEELTNHYNKIKGLADEVYGPQGLKAQDIAASMPKEMSSAMTGQAKELLDMAQGKIANMVSKPNSYPPRLASKLMDDINGFSEAVQHPEATPGSIFNAAQDLKQTLQGYSKFDKFVKPFEEAYDFVRDSKELASKFRGALEDSKVWGKAAARQQAINKAFVEFKPALADFERRFTTKLSGEPTIDPGKINTYMNQLGKPNAEIKQQMLKNFLDASDKYEDVIAKTHANLGMDSPIPPTPLVIARGSLGKIPAGAQMADYLFKKGLSDLGGKTAGAAVGAGIGHMVGAPGIGALVGGHALGPFFSHVLPSLVKPLMNTASHAEGLKSAVDYAMAVSKGETALNKSVKSLFEPGGEVLNESQRPNESNREKIHKTLKAARVNDTSMVGPESKLGIYFPRHAIVVAQTAANASNYLNSLRPNADPQRPLDSKVPPSAVEKAIYNNALDIAHQPLIVLDKIKQGSVTPEDLKHLQNLYPGQYARIADKITAEIIKIKANGDSVPYKTRIGLSMFMAQPLDSTMTPGSILSAQPMPSQTPQEAQGSSPSKVKTSGINKLPKSYQTASQAAEKDRSDRT